MNENKEVKNFLAQLRKFLPEKVIYMALSALPEDIFENDEYLVLPCLSNDEEIQEFISEFGFEDPEKIVCFFMEQYMEYFNEMIDEIFEEMELTYESGIYDFDYNCVYAE